MGGDQLIILMNTPLTFLLEVLESLSYKRYKKLDPESIPVYDSKTKILNRFQYALGGAKSSYMNIFNPI